jgi:hypothetical protein
MGLLSRVGALLDAANAAIAGAPPREKRVPVTAVVTALSMTLYQSWRVVVPDSVKDELSSHPTWGNYPLLAAELGLRFVLYVVIPGLVARHYGLGARDLGLDPRGLLAHVKRFGWVYVALYAIVAPGVWLVSGTPAFQAMYPRYGLAGVDGVHLAAWWALYACIFFAVEFFFRGFLLAMLAPALGVNAAFVAMVPYTLGHLGKPLPEALGAIVTGSVLGILALRTRSIWLGWALHCSVAFTMEALVLAGRHQLPLPFTSH